MIVQGLIETKEYFTGETKDNYFVIYEKFENTDAVFKGNIVEENHCGTEEFIQILRGNEECSCSLRNVISFRVGDQCKSVDEILLKIKSEHKDIFKSN
ncbi:hypothetical protein ACJ2A9_11585 [Anaerobacillus sp. MEB173]|uniref:hypothetical protein n=1 Tax=Anaerobacillus sp. MEB173 TaxID=3383345 RepID=UPI003F8EB7B3